MTIPRIEHLKIQNYRALANLELNKISPLTVFLGPNGSGKSTIFDVFAFLSECFTQGLRRALDRRGRFKELLTRGKEGHPLTITLKYREAPDEPLITYHLAIKEDSGVPCVDKEWLRWKRGRHGQPFKFLDFSGGKGAVVSGDVPDKQAQRIEEQLVSSEVLAVNTLGQLAKNPRVSALRRFIVGWHLSYLNADLARGQTEAGPQERLSSTGDNLSNVIQFLKEQHEDRLKNILSNLTLRVPRLEGVTSEPMQDGRLLLQLKDAPFEKPILARFASSGTLKMLQYLTLLYDPDPPQLIGLEEPENFLHPRLLPELAEECQKASSRSQLMVTTHSPFFVNGLKPKELWVLYRNANGYTQARQVADMQMILKFIEEGAQLGDLWMEGFFEGGDPLVNQGEPPAQPGAGNRRAARHAN
jgi:predicted ATPase